MSRRNLISLSFAIIVLFFLANFVFIKLGESWQIFPDVIYTFAPLLAVLLGFWAVKIFGFNKQGTPIFFLSLGMASYLIAEIIFIIIDNFLDIPTTPSIADFFYILAYPLFFIGLMKKIISEGVGFSFRKNFVFIILAIIFVALFAHFSVYSAFDPEANFWQNVILISYGVGDIILSICCLFILIITYEYEGGRMAYSWLILTMSFLITLVSDLFFAIYPEQYEDVISFKIIIDIFYILGYILFAMAMFHLISLVKEKQESLKAKMLNQ